MVLEVHVENSRLAAVRSVLLHEFEAKLLGQSDNVLQVFCEACQEPARVKGEILAIEGVKRLDWMS